MSKHSVATFESPVLARTSGASIAPAPLPTFDVRDLEERSAALLSRLQIDLHALRGAKVVDVHGMGTFALATALAGAHVTSITQDEARADWTARLFQRQRQTVRITPDFGAIEHADVIVFADGDAPMRDPLARLPRVLRSMHPTAKVIAFVPERHARLRRVLRCRVLAQIARSRDEFVRAAHRLFPRVTDAWSKLDPHRDADQCIFERVTAALPLLPTRAEVLETVAECGAVVRAVDPSTGLEPTDDRLDALWSSWRGGDEGGAAALTQLEQRIAARDYDEQHLRVLDSPAELDRVAFLIERSG
jgi:hypothetical protein